MLVAHLERLGDIIIFILSVNTQLSVTKKGINFDRNQFYFQIVLAVTNGKKWKTVFVIFASNMSDEIKERAIEVFKTFAKLVISGDATGEDFSTFREGLRSIAEDLGKDLSAYDEHIRPILDEAAENFDVEVFKQQLKAIAERICEHFEIDPAVINEE